MDSGNQKVKQQKPQPFTGSLYEVLSGDIDSAKLDAWIAGLPLSALEGRRKSQSWDLVHGL
ncbi:hypothetical protein ECZU12_25380 [Escherichia coli]|nr:hypothetical protein ECZU12_25380 [Escherichia coli]